MRGKRSSVLPVMLVSALVLSLLQVAGRAGDEEIARLLYRKAQKATRAESFQEAADLYRRALEEHTPYPEAAFGLGESLEKLAKSNEALLAYIACKDQAAKIEKLNTRQKRALSSAIRAIGRIGKGYAELEKVERGLVKDCLAYGKKYISKQPQWAKRGYEIVLAVDPGNEAAAKSIKKLAGVRAMAFGRPERLLEDDSMAGWELGEYAPQWTCKKGVLRGDSNDGDMSGWMLRRFFRGNLTIRWEMRLAETSSSDWQCGLIFGEPRTPRDGFGVLLGPNSMLQLSRIDGADIQIPKNTHLDGFDCRQWHQYELQSDTDGLTVRLDGKKIFSHRPSADQEARGNIGLHVSRACVEFRSLEVIK